MTFRIIRPFATSELYASGPAIGTETKIDPATDTQGFIPETGADAQGVNWLFNALATPSRRSVTVQAFHCTPLDITLDDTTNALAVVTVENGGDSVGAPAVVIKADSVGVVYATDSSFVTQGDPVTSITGTVTGAAYDTDSARIVAIGTGGNNNCVSTDYGATWSAGGSMGAVPQDIIHNSTLDLFIASFASGTNVSRSVAGATWTSASSSLAASAQGGIACLASGRSVVCGSEGGGNFPRFSKSDDAITWTDTGGFPSGTFDNTGFICGENTDEIFHVGTKNSGSTLVISASADGIAWTTRASFTTSTNNLPPANAQPDIKPRILRCRNSGLMVVLGCRVAESKIFAIASADDGFTWTSPAFFRGTSLASFALSNGKLFHTVGGRVEQSAGIDWGPVP